MSEFRVHHLITELIALLRRGDRNPATGAEDYADLLLKSVTPYLTAQIGAGMAIKKLSENSSVPAEFKRKYEELKGKNVRDLDALVYLLFKISDDEMTKTFLARNAQEMLEIPVSSRSHPSAASVASGKMSAEEMSQLRIRLVKEIGHGANRNLLRDVKSGQQKHIDANNIPAMPSWIKDRPHLTLDFVSDSTELHEPEAAIGAVPLPSQEHSLLEDILNCMGGDSGIHIWALPLDNPHAIRTFSMDESIDVCFKELIQRILPICSYFSLVSRFIEEKFLFQYGQVNHSLCSAMRSLIKDYLMLIAQLEHQHRLGLLTLQRLWLYIQPTMQTMEILADIATAINKGNATGGAVLSLLHERTCNMMGDPRAQELCLHLTEAACVPYFEILEKWIYKGIICDSFGEFLVVDNELVNKEDLPVDYSDDYWEKRYTICKEKIPVFLEKVADMILRTGKYLNVIRQCGQDVKCPDAEGIVYKLNERHYVEKIEKSYSFASKKLLDLLMEEKDLMGRLRSVKHYFLLDQGDFIVQFMDMADEELKKNIDDIMPTRLESLLELALRTSVANSDPYKDDVRVMLLPYDLLSQMFRILSIETKNEEEYKIPTECELTGLEAFAFHYEVKWPLSLILNRKVLALYQMLFRQLLYLRHVERLLCNVWLSDKVSKCFPLSASLSYAPAFALRQRMLNYVQNLEYYMMFEVIEPSWRIFLNKLQSVANVDDVLHCHFDFLDVCLKDCMLTNPELLRIVNKLMKTFVEFSNFILHMTTYSVDAEMSCMLQTASDGERGSSRSEPVTPLTLSDSESFEQKIEKFNREFVEHLIILLDRISDLGRDNYNEKLVNILYRVDFNSFYTERLERYVAERSMIRSTGEKQKKKPPVPPKSPRVARMQGTYGESSG